MICHATGAMTYAADAIAESLLRTVVLPYSYTLRIPEMLVLWRTDDFSNSPSPQVYE